MVDPLTASGRFDVLVIVCVAFCLAVAGRFLFRKRRNRDNTIIDFVVAALLVTVIVLVVMRGGIPAR